MILTRKTGEKPVPAPLCPPQISHGLTRAQTRASAVRGQRLTAWAMARPGQCFKIRPDRILPSSLFTINLLSDPIQSECSMPSNFLVQHNNRYTLLLENIIRNISFLLFPSSYALFHTFFLNVTVLHCNVFTRPVHNQTSIWLLVG
jgi:hypothetical protein